MKEEFERAKSRVQARNNQTQIIATLGPATSTYETLKAIYEAGADTFRLNFSHGTQEQHAKSIALIRQLEKDIGAPIGILADMQGPKLRIGAFADDAKIPLVPGQTIKFDLDPAPGDATRVSFPHPDILAALEPGAKFLMDDGNVGMKIAEKGDGYVIAEVVYGNELSGKKGVNVPALARHVDALTAKDKSDLEFALSHGVDWIAQSFVQDASDILEAKKLINGRAKLIAKMEKPAAVRNMKEIIAEVDAIMVARGDLGVEIPLTQVPGVQAALIEEAIRQNKPVVVATHMFDSMRENPRPTRAEVSDVNLAVLQGASGVMLSGETSVGKYPVKAVETMDETVSEAERGLHHSRATMKNPPLAPPFEARPTLADAPAAKPVPPRYGT
ncbi:MAG TPA: pyruvate kinase [Patescibacteria group bacterium]|nr:pyruvate kinase [Patescibacteria group bacterium]